MPVIRLSQFIELLRSSSDARHCIASGPKRRPGFGRRGGILAASLFMASCEGTITMDLATQAPADATLQQVIAPFVGLDFQKSDGATERLELSDAEPLDLIASVSGNPLRLFTDEDLPTGDYTGVRLLFDEENTDDAFVIDGLGAERTLTITSGEYADIDFSVAEDETSSAALTLTLDLRLSLSSNDNEEYLLEPVLRSVPTDEAGALQGAASAACITDDAAFNEAAVYLFEGEDVTPDDHDGQGAEPYVTAPVVLDTVSGGFIYALRFLPAGTYTVALACDGDLEDPTTDEDLDFQAAENVDIEEGETLQQDL